MSEERIPLVTVYITNHNYSRFIEKAIKSVLNQTLNDLELIIIDDGSTDNSRQIIEQYRHDPRVKIVYQQNKGLNVSNNIALHLARGKYIMRLDADDYLDENALLIMSNKLGSDPNLALVFPDYFLIDEHGNIFAHERRHDFEEVTLFDQPAHGACTMFRKDILLQVGGYSEDYKCQDGYDLWLKLIKKFKVGNVNLPLFYYRQHDKSLTKNQSAILSTRHEIIRKNSKYNGVKDKNHVCIIPVRGREDNIPVALRPFAGTTIMDITIQNVLKSENISHVVVSTPDKKIIEYIKRGYTDKIIVNERPEELVGINTKLENTIDYLLETYKIQLGIPDTLTVINVEYPLRKWFYVDKAINTLYLFDVDSVLSVKLKDANFYKHNGSGLIPFETNRELRLERDFIYEATGGIHTTRYDSYMQYHSLSSGRIGHIIIDEWSSIRLTNGTDFRILEYLYEKQKGSVE